MVGDVVDVEDPVMLSMYVRDFIFSTLLRDFRRRLRVGVVVVDDVHAISPTGKGVDVSNDNVVAAVDPASSPASKGKRKMEPPT